LTFARNKAVRKLPYVAAKRRKSFIIKRGMM
jgi:hypothetical protein